jgi:hypothetical protein
MIQLLVACQHCDIMFIFDSSESITSSIFHDVTLFARSLSLLWPVNATDGVLFSFVAFSDNVFLSADFNQFKTNDDVDWAISKIPYTPGDTNTAALVHQLVLFICKHFRAFTRAQQIFTTTSRSNVGRSIVFFSDGR